MEFKIEQKESTKILGYIINNDLNHEKYINSIISRVNQRLQTFRIINNYMNLKVKIMVLSSLVISIIRYVLPLLINVNKNNGI